MSRVFHSSKSLWNESLPSYSFDTLSSLDFEYLCRDLLQKKFNCHIESFKTGRDGGVDLRFAPVKGQAWIVQCKHYVESSFSALKRAVRKEIPKLKKRKPDRYILCTALKLLPQHKDQLLDLLKPYCKSTDDIFGNECLNNLLGQHPEIERQQFKLWLCSENILQAILKSEVFKRTAMDIEEIKLRISMFVTTPAIFRAEQILEKNGYCLIVGVPGIGKTTTAELLLAMQVKRNWTALSITSASQAVGIISGKERQVIYYDDFLGQTKLENKLEKNEEDEIKRLIHHCQRNPKTKRFILTTRELILEQAKVVYGKLKDSRLDLSTCTIRLADYTKKIRAQILLNHLYFFKIPRKVRVYLVDKEYARKIVGHPHYSPRIIEGMCERFHAKPLTPARFAKAFMAFLDNPSEIWETAYSQLSDDGRMLLVCFASIGQNVAEQHLRGSFKSFANVASNELELRFRNALKSLEGNFIESQTHRSLLQDIVLFQFHNPSVKDFSDRIVSESAMTCAIVEQAIYHAQIASVSVFSNANAETVIDAVKRTIHSGEPTFHVYANTTLPKQVVISARIVFWFDQLNRHAQLNELKPFLLQLGEQQLKRGEHSSFDSSRDVVALFGLLKKELGGNFKYNVKHVYEAIESSISSSDDFVYLDEFLDDLPDHERDELGVDARTEFFKFANQQLHDTAHSAESASEVEGMLEDVRSVMDRFGFDDEQLDGIQAAEESAGSWQLKEEELADLERADYAFDRDKQQEVEQEINNILDSIRE